MWRVFVFIYVVVLVLAGCGEEPATVAPVVELWAAPEFQNAAQSRGTDRSVSICSVLTMDGEFARFTIRARDYRAAADGPIPADQLDAFGLDWFHDAMWAPVAIEWADTWGGPWGDGNGDWHDWMHDAVLYPNQYVMHHGGRAAAIHAPGDWIWSEHFAAGEWADILTVVYQPGSGPPPHVAPGPYEGSGTWGPSADFEGGSVCRAKLSGLVR